MINWQSCTHLQLQPVAVISSTRWRSPLQHHPMVITTVTDGGDHHHNITIVTDITSTMRLHSNKLPRLEVEPHLPARHHEGDNVHASSDPAVDGSLTGGK